MIVDADDAPQKVAQVVKEQLETTLPGLTVNLTVEPKKQRVQDMQDGNFQLGLTRWGPDYADPMTYLGMWVTGNSNNYGLWSDAEFDSIIEECTTGDLCTDPEGRDDFLRRQGCGASPLRSEPRVQAHHQERLIEHPLLNKAAQWPAKATVRLFGIVPVRGLRTTDRGQENQRGFT